ncbi:RING-H2 finger protein ATL73 [Abeliophyllum distichum]|uniref:RING-type E3 ubiquitin transferase n=1 Tax=Abeliophyllum distichum TaxID=126358 RepID=A0ABD1RCT3_9LAMI
MHRNILSRLLLDTDSSITSSNSNKSSSSSSYNGSDSNFDSNMVIILAALLCALICALGLNSIVRCVIRCSRRFGLETVEEEAAAASTGLKKETLGLIPVVVFKSGLHIPATDCPICIGEFKEGENVRLLPRCNHGFHAKCIDKWLVLQSSCPTCRQPLFEHSANSKAEEFVSVGIRHGVI